MKPDWTDTMSVAAHDWLSIYAFAVAAGTGEDRDQVMQRLVLACFRRQNVRERGYAVQRVNLRTAEAVVAEEDARQKQAAATRLNLFADADSYCCD